MNKKQVVDSHIKKLQKIDNENVDWFFEKKNLISMIENGGLIERKWQLKKLIEDHCKENKSAKNFGLWMRYRHFKYTFTFERL